MARQNDPARFAVLNKTFVIVILVFTRVRAEFPVLSARFNWTLTLCAFHNLQVLMNEVTKMQLTRFYPLMNFCFYFLGLSRLYSIYSQYRNKKAAVISQNPYWHYI